MSSLNVFAQGGIVMWPLLALSLLSVALILERLVFWSRIVRKQDRLVRLVLTTYPRDRTKALQYLKQNVQLPVARIFLSALGLKNATSEEFRIALESSAQAELLLFRRFNTVFTTIISVSPLLGLLGTVLGLMDSFASLRIGDLGGSDTTTVTAGISEALISTAFGLIVAIGTLLFANIFRGLYLRQVARIQEYGGQLELLHRRYDY